MKTSKVTKAFLVTNEQGEPKIWNGQHGTMYFHWIEFQNGDKGEYMSKSQSQDKFKLDQEVKYEIIPNSNPQYAAKIKPFNEGFSKKGDSNPRYMTAKYASEIVIAYINNGHKVEKSWFTDWADYIEAWTKGENVKAPEIPQKESEPTDDLPF